MRKIGTHWTLEMTEELKARRVAGDSVSQIAAAMSNGTLMTRNMVIGKLWREGLSARRKITFDDKGNIVKTRARPRQRTSADIIHNARRRRRASDQKASAIGWQWNSDRTQLTSPSLPVDMAHTAPGMKGIGLEDLNDGHCRWPLWAHTRKPWDSAAVLYCGAPALRDCPYCGFHSRLAYSPASDRRINTWVNSES